jgi:AraC-like DNA-binding protein
MTPRRIWTNSLIEESTLAVWLTPMELSTVTAQLADRVTLLNIQNVSALVETLASDQAHAVLLSAARLDTGMIDQLTQVRRTFPRVPILGLMTHEASDGADWRASTLSRLGVHTVADLTSADGWRSLRNAVDNLPTTLERRAVASVSEALGNQGTDGWYRFIAAAFRGDAVTVKQVAEASDADPRQFESRFLNARLPEPRRYLEVAMLARVAYLSESTYWSIAGIANAMNASSRQAFAVRIRRLTGLSPLQWRREHDVTWVLDEMCSRYVKPYHAVLRTFDPYTTLRWQSKRRLLARESILWGQCNDRVSGSAAGP